MLATHSVSFAPLRPAEAEGLRLRARAERGFEAAAQRASRLVLLSAASSGRLDPEAAVGLRLDEADAIVALVRTPARTRAERAWKAAVVRSWRDGGGGDPLVDAMLDAALEAERPKAAGPSAQVGRGRGRS